MCLPMAELACDVVVKGGKVDRVPSPAPAGEARSDNVDNATSSNKLLEDQQHYFAAGEVRRSTLAVRK